MKRLEFTYRTHIDFEFPVVDHYFTLRCMPRPSATQRPLACQLSLFPETPWSLQRDGYGNLLQVGACRSPHSGFTFHATGTVAVDLSRRELEPCHPAFGCPSALTQSSPELRRFLSAHCPPSGTPLEQARGLMYAVHDHITYTPGVTSIHTTAAQSFALGKGVCQDESHILIALCRMAGIPARYVCGLTVGEGATHAWMEVWSDGFWYGLDPTRNKDVDETYLVIALGRDYYDCPVERGVLKGSGYQKQFVYMRVSEQ